MNYNMNFLTLECHYSNKLNTKKLSCKVRDAIFGYTLKLDTKDFETSTCFSAPEVCIIPIYAYYSSLNAIEYRYIKI